MRPRPSLKLGKDTFYPANRDGRLPGDYGVEISLRIG